MRPQTFFQDLLYTIVCHFQTFCLPPFVTWHFALYHSYLAQALSPYSQDQGLLACAQCYYIIVLKDLRITDRFWTPDTFKLVCLVPTRTRTLCSLVNTSPNQCSPECLFRWFGHLGRNVVIAWRWCFYFRPMYMISHTEPGSSIFIFLSDVVGAWSYHLGVFSILRFNN